MDPLEEPLDVSGWPPGVGLPGALERSYERQVRLTRRNISFLLPLFGAVLGNQISHAVRRWIPIGDQVPEQKSARQ